MQTFQTPVAPHRNKEKGRSRIMKGMIKRGVGGREERRKRENNMGEQNSFNNTLKGYKQIFELIKFSKMK